MQLSILFSAVVAIALSAQVTANPIAAPRAADETPDYLISVDQLKHWLATTDANITFIGAPINALTPRSALNTIVTYCSNRDRNTCVGPCTVYNGGATCLNAPDTNCLAATNNVNFCDNGSCNGSCNVLSSCGTRLDNGFCFTPGTASIEVIE